MQELQKDTNNNPDSQYDTNVVSPLKKIFISLKAGTDEEKWNLTAETLRFDFIYGIGIEGLSPLECALSGKKAGEKVNIFIAPDELSEFIQPLPLCGFILPQGATQLYLHLCIDKIERVENREIVAAIAKKNEDGCGCGCGSGSAPGSGCGCGI